MRYSNSVHYERTPESAPRGYTVVRTPRPPLAAGGRPKMRTFQLGGVALPTPRSRQLDLEPPAPYPGRPDIEPWGWAVRARRNGKTRPQNGEFCLRLICELGFEGKSPRSTRSLVSATMAAFGNFCRFYRYFPRNLRLPGGSRHSSRPGRGYPPYPDAFRAKKSRHQNRRLQVALRGIFRGPSVPGRALT